MLGNHSLCAAATPAAAYRLANATVHTAFPAGLASCCLDNATASGVALAPPAAADADITAAARRALGAYPRPY